MGLKIAILPTGAELRGASFSRRTLGQRGIFFACARRLGDVEDFLLDGAVFYPEFDDLQSL